MPSGSKSGFKGSGTEVFDEGRVLLAFLGMSRQKPEKLTRPRLSDQYSCDKSMNMPAGQVSW